MIGLIEWDTRSLDYSSHEQSFNFHRDPNGESHFLFFGRPIKSLYTLMVKLILLGLALS